MIVHLSTFADGLFSGDCFSLNDVLAKLAPSQCYNQSVRLSLVLILERPRQIISSVTVRLMRRLRDNAGDVVITALSVPGDRLDDDDDDDCFFSNSHPAENEKLM